MKLFKYPLIFILSFLFQEAISQNWMKKGNGIEGEADKDQSGFSVSMNSNGDIVAIGAPYNGGSGTKAGHVRIYKSINGTWTQVGTDIEGKANSDQLGFSISMNGDGSMVAVGAPGNSGGGSLRGQVRVYKYINNTWQQVGLDINGEADNDFFGTAVSMSSDGSIVAIGSNLNAGGGTYRGHVRIYKLNSGTWTQIGADIDGEDDRDFSGSAVSLSDDGNIVAIGAILNAGGGNARGQVRVYKNNNGSWIQMGADIDGEADNNKSGYSVSLNNDGSIVAIGAPNNSNGGVAKGHVRIHKFNNGAWTQIGSDIDGEANNDNSGSSVSLNDDGNIVAIGAPNKDGSGIQRGQVRVFKNNNGTWTQVGSSIDGAADIDQLGWSVALNKSGDVFVSGALSSSAGGVERGQALIYGFTTHSYISLSTCDSLISPSGKYIYHQSGIYSDTVTSSSGADSFLTIYANITITNMNIKKQSICKNNSATINIPATQSGVNYYLYTKNDSILQGPIAGGNGDTIK